MDLDDWSFDGSELTEGERSHQQNHPVYRPENVRFHATQKILRDIAPLSLAVGRINKDAMHKLDFNMVAQQEKINDVYCNDAKVVFPLYIFFCSSA